MNASGNTSTKVAADATTKILSILPKDGEGTAVGTRDPAVGAKVGAIVDEAVAAAGGDARALFAVTKAMARQLPFGAKWLRSLRRACRRDRIIGETALVVFELLAGDPAADFVTIGERVDAMLGLCGGAFFESDVLARLGAKLNLSSRKLGQHKDAFLVSQLGGAELARLVASRHPAPCLAGLAPILKVDVMPWRKKDLIVKVAEEVASRGLAGKAIAKLVGELIAEESGKSEAPGVISPAWNLPRATAPGTDASGDAAVQPAA